MSKGRDKDKGGDKLSDASTTGPDRNRLRVAFECPRGWDALTPTVDPSVRHCVHCDQTVHLCTDAETARKHARVAHCVAMPKLVSPYRGTVEVPSTVVVQRGNEPARMFVGLLMDPQVPPRSRPVSALGWLVLVDGPGRGMLFELGYGTTVIGSGRKAQIRLQHDKDIRAEHSRIDVHRDGPDRDKFRLQDAHVDGKLVSSVILWDGDIFVVGNTSIAFKRLD